MKKVFKLVKSKKKKGEDEGSPTPSRASTSTSRRGSVVSNVLRRGSKSSTGIVEKVP